VKKKRERGLRCVFVKWQGEREREEGKEGEREREKEGKEESNTRKI